MLKGSSYDLPKRLITRLHYTLMSLLHRRRERYKRDPADSGDSTPFQLTPGSETESLPKRIQKRQSEGNRYASDFQGDDRSGQGGANPRGSHQNSYRVAGDGGGQFEYSPFISLVTEGNGGGRGTNENPNRNLEVEFGPPPNFGQSPENSPGYDFDFSIPKDLQQDISQSDTANTENRPIFSTGTGFGNDFDIGYDDYVKKHFPEAFGPTRPPGSDNQRQTGPSGMSFRFLFLIYVSSISVFVIFKKIVQSVCNW